MYSYNPNKTHIDIKQAYNSENKRNYITTKVYMWITCLGKYHFLVHYN